MATYSSAFNTNTLSDVDDISVSDLSVSDTLDMTGAVVSGIPVDNITIAFTNHELTLIDGSIDTNHIKDRAITEIKIALGAVGTPELGI